MANDKCSFTIIVYEPKKWVQHPRPVRYLAQKNYAERIDYLIEVEILGFGVQEGLVFL